MSILRIHKPLAQRMSKRQLERRFDKSLASEKIRRRKAYISLQIRLKRQVTLRNSINSQRKSHAAIRHA